MAGKNPMQAGHYGVPVTLARCPEDLGHIAIDPAISVHAAASWRARCAKDTLSKRNHRLPRLKFVANKKTGEAEWASPVDFNKTTTTRPCSRGDEGRVRNGSPAPRLNPAGRPIRNVIIWPRHGIRFDDRAPDTQRCHTMPTATNQIIASSPFCTISRSRRIHPGRTWLHGVVDMTPAPEEQDQRIDEQQEHHDDTHPQPQPTASALSARRSCRRWPLPSRPQHRGQAVDRDDTSISRR